MRDEFGHVRMRESREGVVDDEIPSAEGREVPAQFASGRVRWEHQHVLRTRFGSGRDKNRYVGGERVEILSVMSGQPREILQIIDQWRLVAAPEHSNARGVTVDFL